MKIAFLIITVLAAICAAFAYVPTIQRPRPGSQFPTFPGQGPFNPKPKWPYAPPPRF